MGVFLDGYLGHGWRDPLLCSRWARSSTSTELMLPSSECSTTKSEIILLVGPGKFMTSYKSELGEIVAGIAVVGTFTQSGIFNVQTVAFVCNNSSAIVAARRDLTQSIFYCIKGDQNLIAAMKDLQHNWCKEITISYAW
jgi:hypothetical protein